MQLNTYISIDKRYLTSKGDNTGKYQIKLWVVFHRFVNSKRKRSPKDYPTGLFTTEEDYYLMMDEKKRTKRQDLISIKRELQNIKAKADDLIKKYNIRDERTFNTLYKSDTDLTTVKGQFEIMINKQLDKPRPRISTAEKYKVALASLIEFSHENLTFQEITPDFLEEYQQWYIAPNEIGKRQSITSVGINCRHLRAVFKQAIRLHVVSPEIYPFGKDLYVIPEGGREVEIFLTVEQKNALLNYTPPNKEIAYYYDFAVFDYFANGINFADIATMKCYQVTGSEYITVERQKTEGRNKRIRKIIIPIHARMKEIMIRRGNKTIDPNGYVFPILTKDMSPKEIFDTIRQFVRKTNEALEVISIDLELPFKMTTYTLRHTYSYMMMEMGASTEHLQDGLGHGDIKTTENYKRGFSLGLKKKFSDALG